MTSKLPAPMKEGVIHASEGNRTKDKEQQKYEAQIILFVKT
jgi:hypothetical protein